MTDELKPCPFCGGKPIGPRFECEQGRYDCYSIGCDNCDFTVEGPLDAYDGKASTIKHWNTRASQLPAEDAVERVARALFDRGNIFTTKWGDCGHEYWKDLARAAIQALSKDEGLRSALEARDAVIAAMADAIDEADNIISINCGTDTPKEWDRAFRRVQRARIKLSHREDI